MERSTPIDMDEHDGEGWNPDEDPLLEVENLQTWFPVRKGLLAGWDELRRTYRENAPR